MTTQARIITREDFSAKWLPLFNEVFSGKAILDGPFSNQTWKRIFVPYGLSFEDIDYMSLSKATKSVGDEKVIITDIEPVPPHQMTVVISWNRKTLEWVRCHTHLNHFDRALFGQSGRWGAINTVDDYCCIGGDDKFMEDFVSMEGGLKAIKERFLRFLKEESGFDQIFQETLCASVGWQGNSPRRLG